MHLKRYGEPFNKISVAKLKDQETIIGFKANTKKDNA